MDDCLFCKIASGKIPSKKVYEDEYCYAFYDISPASPVHFLIIPKEHIESANQITPENSHIIARIYEVIPKIAAELGIEKDGYRIVSNCGKNAMQSVLHLHFHVLGGRNLTWPPG